MKIFNGYILSKYIKKHLDNNVLESFKVFYKRGNQTSKFDFFESPDDLLLYAHNNDIDYVIVSWFGVFHTDIWQFKNKCKDVINKLNDEPWLIASYIIDKEKQKNKTEYKNHFYPYPILSIVNVNTWAEIGKPNWGNEGDTKRIIIPEPSEECIHDNYTPLRLFPTDLEFKYENLSAGYNIFDSSLRNNIPVKNIPIPLRKSIIHTYPENGPWDLNNLMNSYFNLPMPAHENQIKLINFLLQSKNSSYTKKKQVFYFQNTELIVPEQYEFNKIKQSIDTIITPCSMFKSFLLGKSFDVNIKKYIHFDIYDQNIRLKKYITNRWNGQFSDIPIEEIKDWNDLKVLLNYEIGDNWNCYDQPPDEDIQTWQHNFLKSVYNSLLEYFKNKKDLETKWLEYKNEEHIYINCNIFYDSNKLVKTIKESQCKNILLCLGDIPGFECNSLNFGIENINNIIKKLIDDILLICNEVHVDIKLPTTDEQILVNGKELYKYLM